MSSSPSTKPLTLPFGKNGNPATFAKWAKSREIFLHPDVAFLIPTKTMGLGVYAARPLPKGSTVVSCPLAASVSPYEKPCAESQGLQVIAQQQSQYASVSTLLIVCLRLLEAIGKPNHPWKPWLEACPLMPDHLFHLAPALHALTSSKKVEISLTTPSEAALAAEVELAPFLTECFQKTVASLLTPEGHPFAWSNVAQSLLSVNVPALWRQAHAIMSQHPSIWPEKVITYPIFCQVLSQVLSRNFHREEVKGQEGPYLLPGVDFVNHDAALTNATFQIHGGGRSRALTFDVITTKDLQKGEQVYYNYGEIVNARFLVEFQFVPQHNLLDALQFSLTMMETLGTAVRLQKEEEQGGGSNSPAQHQKVVRERISALQKLNLLTDDGFYLQGEVRFEKRVAAALDAKKSDPTSSVAVNDATFFRGLEHSWWNMVHLLVVATDAEFAELQSKVSHHWQCPKTPRLLEASSAMLTLRLQSVKVNVKAITTLLEEEGEQRNGDGESVRLLGWKALQTTQKALELLKVTLVREVEMLAEIVGTEKR